MMRPKSAFFYLDKLQDIGDEFNNYLRRYRDPNTSLVSDFILPCQRFALESITAIALDTRLGCLDEDIPEDVERSYKIQYL